jgi:hypothetical protein
MTSHPRIVSIVASTVVLWAAAPAAAPANSLLSGYGGPGVGNQAIIGATLLNGPGGKSGGGGGGASAGGRSTGPSSSSGSGEQSGAVGSPSTRVPSSGGGVRSGAAVAADRVKARSGGGGRGSGSGSREPDEGKASAGSVRTYSAPLAARVSDATVGGSGTLGLSGDDFLYVLLAFAGLAFTGVLTRRLARTRGPESNVR